MIELNNKWFFKSLIGNEHKKRSKKLKKNKNSSLPKDLSWNA